jgi:hypothetical protein
MSSSGNGRLEMLLRYCGEPMVDGSLAESLKVVNAAWVYVELVGL